MLSAAAFAQAKETPKIALAPNFPLLSVPSNSISVLSINGCSKTFKPIYSGAITSFTFLTALRTLFP